MMRCKIFFLFIALFGLSVFGTAFADYIVSMSSSTGISGVPSAPFLFKVDNGHWIKVSAGKTVVKKFKHPVSSVVVKFGVGTEIAVLPSCHKIIKYGYPDKAKSNPSSKHSFPVFSSYLKVVKHIPIENGNAYFTLANWGSNYCYSSNSDCMVYDCFPSSV